MRFAFVTDELPRSGVAGHLAFNHAVIGWLRGSGHQVTILLVRPRLRLPVERYEDGPVAGPGLAVWRNHVFAGAPGDAVEILGRYVLGLLPAGLAGVLRRRGREKKYGIVDTVLGGFITPSQSAWCAARIARLDVDAVLVDTMFRAAVLSEPALHGVNSVIIAHDVFHLRHRALAAAGYKVHPVVLNRDMEARMLNLSHGIAASQPEEATELRAMCPERLVVCTPMPAVTCPRPAGAPDRAPDNLVFVGSDALPNLDGLRWFFAEIWPRLKTWRSTLTLDLVGDCVRGIATPPDGVTRIGRVKNLSVVLHRSGLAISPLRVGSGLKLKLLDYARHGLITVATPVSIAGFASDDAAPFIAASDPVAFTVAVADQLRRDRPAADEQRALAYIARHYGTASAFAGLAEALRLPARLDA